MNRLQDPWMRNAVKEILLQGGVGQALDRVHDELHLLRVVGYSGSGSVIEVGAGVPDLQPGDRVAFAAQGHAEMICPARHMGSLFWGRIATLVETVTGRDQLWGEPGALPGVPPPEAPVADRGLRFTPFERPYDPSAVIAAVRGYGAGA